jgi:predicted nucleotidyltransferase
MKEIESFLEEIRKWAELRNDIKAILLVGSYARGQVHDGSDIDLVLMTNEPDRYLNDYSFTENFGDVDKIEKEYWGRVTSLRIWYKDGREVELGITGPDWITDDPLDIGTLRTITGGAKVVIDRIGNIDEIIASASRVGRWLRIR